MPNRTTLMLCFLLAPCAGAAAQDIPHLPYPPASRYFDFWEGTWYRSVDGRPDTAGTRFVVRPGVRPGVWIEEWRIRSDSTRTDSALAIRGWDATRDRWQYVWVSSLGHFQEWEGRKVGDDWYIYRRFDFPTDHYLSRQAWLPLGPGRLQRISQKSYDDGETWELRFAEEYLRVPPSP